MKPNQNDWQPIETAPKDGRTIIAWIPFLGWQTIEWNEGRWVETFRGEPLRDHQPTQWAETPERPE